VYLLKYRLTDGAIVSSWSANTAELLEPNIVAGDPTYGYLLEESGLTPRQLTERCFVQDGAMQVKTEVTLSATPPTFLADGVASSSITVTPFVPCTVRIAGVPYALTAGDQAVILTADLPQVFPVDLAPHATVWAEPTSVEAT
jgi:hypothetical protein